MMSYEDPVVLAKLRSDGYSDYRIGHMYNVSPTTIRNYRKKFNIATGAAFRGNNRKYSLDKSFFREIDSQEKAYVLGLIASDGYIGSTLKTVNIALSEEDTQILSDVLRVMGSNAPIRKKVKNKRTGYGGTTLSIIYISSVEIVSDLALHGIHRNKSNTIVYPSTIPSFLHRHFIRGLWDGDGNICKANASLCGTHDMLSSVCDIIESETGSRGDIRKDREHHRLFYYRKHAQVLKWIYADSTIHLNRKHLQFLKYWS